MRQIILSLLFTVSLQTFSQTKKIAFKSHGGNMEFFTDAVVNENGDTENFNFGMYIQPEVKTAQLDSLILLCDTAAIMVTSEYCSNRRNASANPSLWKAGRDTVFNHYLFNGRLSLDSIRKVIQKQYFFKNPGKTVYVGFENYITSNSSAPINKSIDSPVNRDMVLMTGMIFGLSLLGGFGAWKFYGRSS